MLASLPGAALVPASFVIQAASTQDSASDAQQNPAPPTEQKTAPAQTPSGTPEPASETKPQTAPDRPAKTKTTAASKATPPRHRRRKKPVTPPSDGPTKVIVKNGGAPDPTVQLSPGVSPEQASRQRQSTDLLLSTTESNLKMLEGHPLNSSQQDMVTQVREYMKQAKASADAGDLQRAHNLAFKAKLLSDELAKQ